MATAFALQATPAHPCSGKPPLYQPERAALSVAGLDPPLTSASLLLASHPARIPVAFAASGDECRGPIPVYAVWHDGRVGERRDSHSMARQLAPMLQEYSQQTGLEGCARMCRSASGGVVAQAVTIDSHVSCIAPPETCPAGSTPLKETIHSHPPQRLFLANAVDALGWDEPGLEGRWVPTGYPNHVSDPDRLQAPVWLVGTSGQLIWLDKTDGKEIERP